MELSIALKAGRGMPGWLWGPAVAQCTCRPWVLFPGGCPGLYTVNQDLQTIDSYSLVKEQLELIVNLIYCTQ